MSRGGRRREVMAKHSPPPLCVVRMRAPPLSCLCALDALRLPSLSRSRGFVSAAAGAEQAVCSGSRPSAASCASEPLCHAPRHDQDLPVRPSHFANPGCLLAAQPLWATEWRSQVMTGWVRRAANGAAFTVGVRLNWRPSVPPVLPFLVVCVGVVCRWGCLWGCSNPLTLSVCRVI